jgi:lipase ATG15
MITGAQTKTPAIGLSGPNTIITRATLHPPVTVESLNKYTFNIVPDRDVVPMIDDFAKNIQRINCLAATNNFVDCHTSVRSLCEIQYTCGSGIRPTLCDCALYYGYPEPEAIGSRTFAEACKK